MKMTRFTWPQLRDHATTRGAIALLSYIKIGKLYRVWLLDNGQVLETEFTEGHAYGVEFEADYLPHIQPNPAAADLNGIPIAFTTTGADNITNTKNATATAVDCSNRKYVTFWFLVTGHGADVAEPTTFRYSFQWSEDGVNFDAQKAKVIDAGEGTFSPYGGLDDISGQAPTYVRHVIVPTLGRRYCKFEVATVEADTTATATVKYQRGG
jgi:hypothetical protein